MERPCDDRLRRCVDRERLLVDGTALPVETKPP